MCPLPHITTTMTITYYIKKSYKDNIDETVVGNLDGSVLICVALLLCCCVAVLI